MTTTRINGSSSATVTLYNPVTLEEEPHMFKGMFSITPGWLKDIQTNGRPAKAIIISDPKDNLKGVKGYEGRDMWLEVTARIESEGAAPFEAKMKCQLTQIVFGMLEKGMTVNAKYDPAHTDRVVLVDDQHTLLQYRVRK